MSAEFKNFGQQELKSIQRKQQQATTFQIKIVWGKNDGKREKPIRIALAGNCKQPLQIRAQCSGSAVAERPI